jgi:hypothetical protein
MLAGWSVNLIVSGLANLSYFFGKPFMQNRQSKSRGRSNYL